MNRSDFSVAYTWWFLASDWLLFSIGPFSYRSSQLTIKMWAVDHSILFGRSSSTFCVFLFEDQVPKPLWVSPQDGLWWTKCSLTTGAIASSPVAWWVKLVAGEVRTNHCWSEWKNIGPKGWTKFNLWSFNIIYDCGLAHTSLTFFDRWLWWQTSSFRVESLSILPDD